MIIAFAQIDAFADRPFAGNPACVMPLDTWLADNVLQAIAQENNVSETAFLVHDATGDSDYELRWFTPELEIALCGHATLASGHYLLTRNGGERITFRTRKSGVLEVSRSGPGYDVDLPAFQTDPIASHPIAETLGHLPEAIRWHENGYLLLIYASAADIRALAPDFRAMAHAGTAKTTVIATAPGDTTDVISRVFVPSAGIDEDPVTGSAHSVLTPYWAERLGRDSFSAFQASARGGHVGCRLAGERVVLSGGCVTVIEGVFTL